MTVLSTSTDDEFLHEISIKMDQAGFDYLDVKRVFEIAVDTEQLIEDSAELDQVRDEAKQYDDEFTDLYNELLKSQDVVAKYKKLVTEVGDIFPENSPYIEKIQTLINDNDLG